MADRGRRRALLGGATVVAVTMALCSAAFACTIFRGKFIVQGSGSNAGKVYAIGANSGMNYCSAGFPTGTARAPRNGGTVTVSVVKNKNSACPTGTPGGRLPSKMYDINFLNGPAHFVTPDRDWQLDCMSGIAGPVKIGQMNVDQYGRGGPKTLSLPSNLAPNGPNDESAVCISDSTGTYGNQVPITIL